ncbi:hypothetical protein B296_00019975 [Ensete ventricosum]|uniref:Uncharacterized protein n=1 Tax=Ensete ventricosum TaxID=4639 RepID=A0A426ZKT1_ENSVE|nr:hypothetical protein B296_00019975 [Ensete ventricosum]
MARVTRGDQEREGPRRGFLGGKQSRACCFGESMNLVDEETMRQSQGEGDRESSTKSRQRKRQRPQEEEEEEELTIVDEGIGATAWRRKKPSGRVKGEKAGTERRDMLRIDLHKF